VGEAGVGKTRLLEELMEQVRRQGGSVAFARCYGSEGHLAFAPVTMLIRSCLPAQLAPVWRSELARLLPELDGTSYGQPHAEHEREPWRRQRLFEALARALHASLPLLLVVDDLQWCDQDSLEWLHFLMRFDHTARLLVVATVRSEDLLEERPISRVVETLRYEQLLETIPVPPLSAPDAASLARSLVGGPLSPDAVHRLYDESEGNPLYIIELVRAGMLTRPSTERLPLPARMEAVLSARFAPLPADARAVAELASTRAGTVTPALLAAAGGLEPAVVAELLDGLELRGIVRESNGHYDFTHGKLRQFACDRIRSARKRVLHLQWARALEADQAGRPGGPGGEVARHYELAGELERAAAAYVTAGEEARQVYALHDAIGHYTAALRCLPDDRGLEVRWQALSGREQVHDMMGSTEARTADLSTMETLAVRERDDRWRATVYVRQSQVAYAQGRLETALERAGAARALAAATGDTRLEALACFCHANALYELDASGLAPAVEALSRGAALARQAGDAPLECRVQSYLAIGYARIGRREEALLCADEALALARTLKDPRREALCQTSRGLALKRLSRFSDARLAHEAAVRLARELALPADLALYEGHLGLACYRLGDFEQAIVHLAAAAGKCAGLNQRANAAGWFSHLGALYGVVGDERKAYHHLEQARSLAQGAAHAWIEGVIACRHATLLAEFGHPEQALEQLSRDQAPGQRAEHPTVGASRLYARGLACTMLERWDEASEVLMRAERALAETTEGDGSVLARPASVLLAEVQLRRGDLEAAGRRLQPFVAEIDAGVEGDVVPERTLYVYSQLLRAQGNPAGAVARLKQAVQLVLEIAGRLTPEHRAAYLHQVPMRRALFEALERERALEAELTDHLGFASQPEGGQRR
jgi:tetratricopeptide (TPR) repeat protein